MKRVKSLARRSPTDKYQRDMLIMAAFQRNVEKFPPASPQAHHH
jgi:hypothetical protein